MVIFRLYDIKLIRYFRVGETSHQMVLTIGVEHQVTFSSSKKFKIRDQMNIIVYK